VTCAVPQCRNSGLSLLRLDARHTFFSTIWINRYRDADARLRPPVVRALTWRRMMFAAQARCLPSPASPLDAPFIPRLSYLSSRPSSRHLAVAG